MVMFMLDISMPKPRSAPMNSATMAPISASTIAISRPAKMNGMAFGSCSIQKI